MFSCHSDAVGVVGDVQLHRTVEPVALLADLPNHLTG